LRALLIRKWFLQAKQYSALLAGGFATSEGVSPLEISIMVTEPGLVDLQ
jgi:hypothetical protein